MVSKMHRMHLPKIGEGVIYVPSGMPFEVDDPPKYLPGSYMRLGNKEFIYAIAGGDLVPDVGAMNSYYQTVIEKQTSAKILKGAMVVTLTIAPGLDIAKDELKGGEIVCYPGDENSFIRGILSNNLVETGPGGVLAVVIDSPTPVEIVATKWCEAIANPYFAVKTNTGDFEMVMGMPTVVATDGQGLWLQVSGPCWVSPLYGTGGPGGAGNLKECVFETNGSIMVRETSRPALQTAGVVICPNATGNGQGSPFIMLQIAH